MIDYKPFLIEHLKNQPVSKEILAPLILNISKAYISLEKLGIYNQYKYHVNIGLILFPNQLFAIMNKHMKEDISYLQIYNKTFTEKHLNYIEYVLSLISISAFVGAICSLQNKIDYDIAYNWIIDNLPSNLYFIDTDKTTDIEIMLNLKVVSLLFTHVDKKYHQFSDTLLEETIEKFLNDQTRRQEWNQMIITKSRKLKHVSELLNTAQEIEDKILKTELPILQKMLETQAKQQS